MARYLTTTGEFDLSAIMAGAWKESQIARRILGNGNDPAIADGLAAPGRIAISNEIYLLAA